jgi:hypothetical protein
LDWDKVAREDRVKRHGSVYVYRDLPRSGSGAAKPWQTKTGIRYAEKLRPRLNAVLKELNIAPKGGLSAARAEAVRQLKRIASTERARLTGPRQRIQRAVLEREIGRALGRARSAPKAGRSQAALKTPTPKQLTTRRASWTLEPLKSSVRTSKAAEGQPHVRVRGTLDEDGLRVHWDADARVDYWLLAIRRNNKIIARQRLTESQWTGKVGVLHATHTLEVRLTGMAGDRMVSWGGAGLTMPRPVRKPGKRRRAKRG